MEYLEESDLPELVDDALQLVLEKVNDAFHDGFQEQDIYFEGGPLQELARTLRDVSDKKKKKKKEKDSKNSGDNSLQKGSVSDDDAAAILTELKEQLLAEDTTVEISSENEKLEAKNRS